MEQIQPDNLKALQDVGDPLNFRRPDFSRPILNMHIISEENECKTIQLYKGMTDEELVGDYAKAFPLELKRFIKEVELDNQALVSSSGMSKNRSLMAIAKIPETIWIGMQYLRGEDYWERKGAVLKFVRRFPKLMIGDHTRKTTKGVIIR